MGTITSSTGLISGMDIQALVESLMKIEARPLDQLTSRIAQAREEQVAVGELTARISALQSSIQTLSRPTSFLTRSASSSDENVLRASASEVTQPGRYAFTVHSLVGTHSVASGAFADANQTPVGAGRLTFEIGSGMLTQPTSLDMLNGFRGISTGIIEITDQRGNSADIDLRTATTVQDIIEAINAADGIRVKAEVAGGAIRIRDVSNGSGALQVRDISGAMAEELGIAGVTEGLSAGEAIAGGELIRLSESARLDALNDGNGVGFNAESPDIRFRLRDGGVIDVNLTAALRMDMNLTQLNNGRGVTLGTIKMTNKAGASATVDLTGSRTLQDVADRIADAGIDVGMALDGSRIVLSDTSGGEVSNFIVEDVSGTAARDLGITADNKTNTIGGANIHRMDTLGDVIRAVRFAHGNESGALQVAISDDGHGLIVTDTSAGMPGEVSEIEALNESTAARDLGLLDGFGTANAIRSRRLIAGANTVLLSTLNGGSGVRTGAIDFTLRDGTNLAVDLSQAETLQDVIEAISAVDGLSASIDSGGTGIRVLDETAGAGVQTVSGTMADDLHLAVNGSGAFTSGDLQRQYITENTLLSKLNGGKGVGSGEFTIISGTGLTASLNMSGQGYETVGDVIRGINNLGIGVTARINAGGDGIELLDAPDGEGTLSVTDDTGTAATDLRIAGTAKEGTHVIDGSFSTTIEIDVNDTLEDVVKKINTSRAGVQASVFSVGAGLNPYRMTITSKTSGMAGRMAFSTDVESLGLNTVAEARDAKVLFGSPDSPGARPIAISSSSNTLTGVVPGLTLDLVKSSEDPVEISIARDTEAIVSSVQKFVEDFNSTMERLDKLTAVDAETGESGVLQGTRAAQQAQNELYRMITSYAPDGTLEYNRLSDLGIMAESQPGGGIRLTMNRSVGSRTINGEQILRSALENDPDAVKDFFTRVKVTDDEELVNIGFAARFKEAIERLTTTGTGSLTSYSAAIDDRVELYQDRSSQLQELLDLKEQRLYRQFQAMEDALAQLQSQQSSLSGLSQMAASFGGGGGLSLG